MFRARAARAWAGGCHPIHARAGEEHVQQRRAENWGPASNSFLYEDEDANERDGRGGAVSFSRGRHPPTGSIPRVVAATHAQNDDDDDSDDDDDAVFDLPSACAKRRVM